MKRSRRPIVAVAGLGLVGGSLARTLSRAGWIVRGAARKAATRHQVVKAGAASAVFSRVRDAAEGADLVVLAVPYQAMSGCLREVAMVQGPRTVVTDVCSVKGPVTAWARQLPYPRMFLGSHPMAGSERSGFMASDPDLFAGRVIAVTPIVRTAPAAIRAVTRMWRTTGARIVSMTPSRHDAAAARVSHLVHLVAIALVEIAQAQPGAFRLASRSFSDATRVAESSPELWDGIFLGNRIPLLAAVDAMIARLRNLRTVVAAGHRGSIGRRMACAGEIRRRELPGRR